MSAIQVTIPTPLLLVGAVVVPFVSVVLFVHALNLLSAIVLYRHYRRSYPTAERGRVWRHVRGDPHRRHRPSARPGPQPARPARGDRARNRHPRHLSDGACIMVVAEMPDNLIDEWPNDKDMALACRCGHMLGQHSYGTTNSECNYCPCDLFNDVMPDGSQATYEPVEEP